MSLDNLRKKINLIDAQVVSLLNERADASRKIGQLKAKDRKGVYAPGREREILERLKELNKGPMSDEAFESIYREVMSASLSLEKSLRIAFLGTAGSYTHMAANKRFGSQVQYAACGSILEVFQKVDQGDCDYGVVPIENSTEGAVTHTLDLFVDFDLKICSEILLPIEHALLSRSRIQSIKKIYSNPQVFGQCRNWLLNNLPGRGQVLVPSTTDAARRAVKEKTSAAIASIQAAKVYRLPVIQRKIQDLAHNTTRFLVIAAGDEERTGKDATSILFSIKDKVGALYAMLTPFYKNGINLTKIESRPSKKKAWDYYFFVDIEGHRSDKKVKHALEQLEGMCKYLKILGSYPVREKK